MDIAVCDDNLSDREIIRQQLSIYFSDRFIEYNIDSYENGVNLIYSIEDLQELVDSLRKSVKSSAWL